TSKKFMIDCMRHKEFIAGNTFTDFIDKNMSERELDSGLLNEIAAIGGVLGSFTGNQKASTIVDKATLSPSPWEMIGNWQIGDSIHE
ncbi:MAG: hypothetical protein U9N54_01700, partial [candidate division Zixibacteria bacterium]|nr:hypothetical protein [candidate division Zixibacteria bacterium]